MIIEAKQILPPAAPEVDKNDIPTKFYITYNDSRERKELTKQCTKQVYQKLVTNKYNKKFRSIFKLMLDEEKDIIEAIEEEEDLEFYGFDRVPDQDTSGGGVNIELVVLAKYPDGSVDVKAKPNALPLTTVEEIKIAVKQASEIQKLDVLDDKYLVTDVRGSFIHVDPTVR